MSKIQQVIEARRLWKHALDGDLRARAEVMETMTTSDFPVLLGAAYGRELLAAYQTAPRIWDRFATRALLSDFRPKKLVDILGGQGALNKVKEGAEYKARQLSEALYEFSVEKYGNRIPLTWEMLKNDDLGAFNNLPGRLAVAARVTEDVVATKALLLPDLSNVNTAFFKSANGNAPAATALTQENLQAAILNITSRKDADGNPIVLTGGCLVVPPALEFTARSILNATEIRTTVSTKTTIEANPMAGRLDLVVNPYLTLNANAKAATTWFVLPSPGGARPGVAVGFLRGEEAPDLRVKADAGNRVGGGALGAEAGSFDDDTIQYRVRHVVGAAPIDPKATFVSLGS